jgi:hypothetical protein
LEASTAIELRSVEAGAERAVEEKAKMTATMEDFIVEDALCFRMNAVGSLMFARPGMLGPVKRYCVLDSSRAIYNGLYMHSIWQDLYVLYNYRLLSLSTIF